MAEELVQGTDGVEDGGEGVADTTAQSTPDSTAGGTKERQPQKPAETPKVNLNELPEFKQYQQNYDRRLNQVLQERQQYEARLKTMEEQQKSAAMADMDDYQREQYLRQEAEQRAQTLEQRMQMLEAERYRDNWIQQLSRESGVSPDQIDKTNPEAAQLSVIRALRQQVTQPSGAGVEEVAQPEPGRQAPPVDLGGGDPRTTEASYRARMGKAKKTNDSYEYIRLQKEAAERGYDVT